MARFDISHRWIVALVCLGCRGNDPRPSDAPAATRASGEPGGAGAPIETAHYRIRASAPRDCAPPERNAPADGARRVGVEVWIEPTGSLQVPANPYYAKLVDGQGDVYEATLGGCGPALGPTLPTPGHPAQGRIVFDVPKRARQFTLLYAPELVGVGKAELAIDLGR